MNPLRRRSGWQWLRENLANACLAAAVALVLLLTWRGIPGHVPGARHTLGEQPRSSGDASTAAATPHHSATDRTRSTRAN